MHDIFYYDYLDSRDIKEILPKVSSARTEYAWLVLNGVDTTDFDFHYVPNKYEQDQVHAWPVGSNLNHYGIYLVPVDVRLMGMEYDFNYHKQVYSLKDPLATGWKWNWDRNIIDENGIDYQWLPDSWDVEYSRHQFSMAGTEQLSYVELIHQGVGNSIHDIKYHKSNFKFAKPIPRVTNINEMPYTHSWVWIIHENIDYSNFNFDWLPDRWDTDKEHGFAMAGTDNLCYTWLHNLDIHMGKSVKCHPTDLKFKEIKKIKNESELVWGRNEFVWIVDDRIDYSNFNFDWLPDAWDKNTWHGFCMKGSEQLAYTYLVNTAKIPTTKKWHDSNLTFKEIKKVYSEAEISWEQDEFVWIIDKRIDYTNFDFTWLPNGWDKDTKHCFCMQDAEQLAYTYLINAKKDSTKIKWHKTDLKFSERKIVYNADDIVWGQDEFVWLLNKNVNYDNFNFNWLPSGWEKNIKHAFAMQGTTQLAETFLINTAEEPAKTKYHISDLQYIKVKKYFKPLDQIEFDASDMFVWSCDDRIDYSEFNFAWLPDAWDIKKIHAFAMKDTEQLAYTYIKHKDCALDAEIKYHKSDLNFKELTLLDQNLDDVLTKFAGQDQFVWLKDQRIDYSNFNFAWLPDAWDKDKLHYFAMQGTEQLAYTAVVNPKYYDKTLEPVYHTSDLQFAQRYVKTWDSELKVSITQKILQDPPEHEWTWYTDERINYDSFDFSWLPDAWDKSKVHAFCMKNAEQLSYTWLVHKDCDLNNLKFKYHASDLEFNDGVIPIVFWPKFTSVHLESDNWQENLRIVASKLAFGSEWIWICDERIDYATFDFDWLPPAWDTDFIHCFTVKGRERLSYTWLVRADNLHKDARYKYHHTELMLQNHYDVIELDMLMDGTKSAYKQQRYLGTMEDALKTAARKTDQEWLWVLSNCCDYTDFNLDYLPELDEVEHTHCWPSGIQQKGDTFLIHIPTYLQTNKFRFNFDHKELARKPWPVVEYTNDNLTEAIKQNPSRSIYTLYKHKDSSVFRVVDVCLWEKRSVTALNKSHSTCLVPRDCVVKKEIYEYPYLEMATVFATEPRIDVIFISNGESQAERNWQKCKKVFGHAQRVDGVNGRLASYQAAAKLSSTNWFIAVFAKCRILDVYDNIGFGWQPDYWQQSKHYIFLNKNLETELIYGHMAPIAYNKKLMLENTGGLDMTLVQQHVVVPITISETDLSDDPWLAWRTAFREVVKLNYYAKGELSVEGEYRLWSWQTKGSEWSQRGAIDAMNYIREHGLTEEAVMPTVEWAWLEQYFKKIYNADITEVITRSTALSDK